MNREFLGTLSVLIGIVGYIPYFRGIFSGRTKPHAFSWLVWAVLTATGFFIQLSEGGGAGSWALGLSSIACTTIFFLALFNLSEFIYVD